MMTTENNLEEAIYKKIYLLVSRNRTTWRSIGATFGLAAGMLSIISGTLLWAIVRILAASRAVFFLNILDALFFALSLPLLILGAHCLDLLEKSQAVLPLQLNRQPFCIEHWPRLRPELPHKN